MNNSKLHIQRDNHLYIPMHTHETPSHPMPQQTTHPLYTQSNQGLYHSPLNVSTHALNKHHNLTPFPSHPITCATRNKRRLHFLYTISVCHWAETPSLSDRPPYAPPMTHLHPLEPRGKISGLAKQLTDMRPFFPSEHGIMLGSGCCLGNFLGEMRWYIVTFWIAV